MLLNKLNFLNHHQTNKSENVECSNIPWKSNLNLLFDVIKLIEISVKQHTLYPCEQKYLLTMY